MNIVVEKQEKINVPVVLDKQMNPVKGKESVEYIEGRADIDIPIIITSDLHHNAQMLMSFIAEKVKEPEKFIFISAGDMAGTGILGSNGDPSDALFEARDYFKMVFCVNGNHDEKSRIEGMRNNDNSHCHIHKRVQEITSLGRIAGIDGIISKKKLVHRMRKQKYMDVLEQITAQPLDWLITHDIPQIPEIMTKSVGDFDFRNHVLKSKIKFHVFGHRNFKTFSGAIDGTTFINVDSRIVCLKN